MGKLLLVDDDKAYLNSLKELVEAEGYTTQICSNGKDALEMQANEPFDIIITDIIMPEIDGLEFIFQIKSKYPLTKIIAVTGGGVFRSMDLLIMAKELGASMVLSKPFSFSMLKVQLKSLAVC